VTGTCQASATWRCAARQVRTPWAAQREVPSSLKARSPSRGFPEKKSLGDEPAAEVGRFGAALLGVEAGEGGEAVVDECGVGNEDHVGAAGLGVQEANVGDAAKYVVHALPLGES